jgi:hypothetical protein
MKVSLTDLQKAIKGLVVMSSDLELMLHSLVENKVCAYVWLFLFNHGRWKLWKQCLHLLRKRINHVPAIFSWSMSLLAFETRLRAQDSRHDSLKVQMCASAATPSCIAAAAVLVKGMLDWHARRAHIHAGAGTVEQGGVSLHETPSIVVQGLFAKSGFHEEVAM